MTSFVIFLFKFKIYVFAISLEAEFLISTIIKKHNFEF